MSSYILFMYNKMQPNIACNTHPYAFASGGILSGDTFSTFSPRTSSDRIFLHDVLRSDKLWRFTSRILPFDVAQFMTS